MRNDNNNLIFNHSGNPETQKPCKSKLISPFLPSKTVTRFPKAVLVGLVLSCSLNAQAATVTNIPISSLTPYQNMSSSPFDAIGCQGVTNQGVLWQNSETEPHLNVDPNNPLHMVAAWHQDRWSNGGGRGIGAAYTRDGGLTWKPLNLPLTRCAGGNDLNNGDFERASDPWISFGPTGITYLSYLGFTTSSDPKLSSPSAINIVRSTDGGVNWDKAITQNITNGIGATSNKGGTNVDDPKQGFGLGVGFDDKNAVTADPNNPKRAYTVWDLFPGNAAYISITNDGGKTWSSANKIYDVQGDLQYPKQAKFGPFRGTIGNVIVVLKDGTLMDQFQRIFAPFITGDPANLYNLPASTTLHYVPNPLNSHQYSVSNAPQALDPVYGPALHDSNLTYLANPAEISFVGTGFSFPFFGNTYSDKIFVSKNGYVNFDLPNSIGDGTAISAVAGPARISGFYTNVNTNTSGASVHAKVLADRAVFTWDHVGVFGQGGSNTFQVVLHNNGTIDIVLESIGAQTGTVGISEGAGAGPINQLHYSSALPVSNLQAGAIVEEYFQTLNELDEVAYIKSTNQGKSWDQTATRVDRIFDSNTLDLEKGIAIRGIGGLPEIAVNPKNGYIYSVWADGRFKSLNLSGVAITMSKDNGKTWSPTKEVDLSGSSAQAFLPMVAVDKDGNVGVMYYDFRNDVPRDATLDTDIWVQRLDANLNFIDETRVTDLSFDMRQSARARGFFQGDYMGFQAVGNDFVGVVGQTNNNGYAIPFFSGADYFLDPEVILNPSANRQDIHFFRVHY